MIWILLAQLTPLYLGWELVSGRRDSLPPAASTPAPEPIPTPEPTSAPATAIAGGSIVIHKAKE